jgi:molybdenum cofactor biosynthesis enzyme MoaA
MKTAKCITCGVEFELAAKRGRPATHCPTHRKAKTGRRVARTSKAAKVVAVPPVIHKAVCARCEKIRTLLGF